MLRLASAISKLRYPPPVADAEETVRRIELALEPVVGRADALLVEHVSVLRGGRIKLTAAQQHGCDATGLRTVRVLERLAGCVVLSVHRNPFARHDAGAEPEPAPGKMCRQRMQLD